MRACPRSAVTSSRQEQDSTQPPSKLLQDPPTTLQSSTLKTHPPPFHTMAHTRGETVAVATGPVMPAWPSGVRARCRVAERSEVQRGVCWPLPPRHHTSPPPPTRRHNAEGLVPPSGATGACRPRGRCWGHLAAWRQTRARRHAEPLELQGRGPGEPLPGWGTATRTPNIT